MSYEVIKSVRANPPLIHCITNYVTVNDVANMVLAVGGSPVMADDIHEVEEITSVCSGLVINMGTLNERTIDSMLLAGKRANELGHVVVLDPVGVGASAFRKRTAARLLEEIRFSVIRGNISEIKTLAEGIGTVKGVDADPSDAVTEENLEQSEILVKSFSKRLKAVVAITGAIDLVADTDSVSVIRNGHPMMARVTGTGCMLDAVIAVYCAANPGYIKKSVEAAVVAEGLCGEIAYQKVIKKKSGTSSFKTYFIDAMSCLDDTQLGRGARIEIR